MYVEQVALMHGMHAPDEPIGAIYRLSPFPLSLNHKKLLLSIFSVCRPLLLFDFSAPVLLAYIIVAKERKLDRIIHESLFRLLLRIPGGILCLLVCDPGIQLKDPAASQFSETPNTSWSNIS